MKRVTYQIADENSWQQVMQGQVEGLTDEQATRVCLILGTVQTENSKTHGREDSQYLKDFFALANREDHGYVPPPPRTPDGDPVNDRQVSSDDPPRTKSSTKPR